MASIKRPLWRTVQILGASLLFTAAAATAANAAVPANPICNGFTESDAAALGYTTYVFGPTNDTLVDLSGDWIWAWMGDGQDSVTTGSGDDMICGKEGNDTIDSGDGIDSVYGGGGNDTINLGDGLFDYAEGGADNDTIDGGPGPDAIYGDDQDVFSTASGVDFLSGGPGDDDLYGGPAGDTLRGNDNNDDLFGDDGADDLKGGNDTDTGDGGGGLSDICNVETPTNCP